MGGGYTWRVATQAGSRIRAAVPWYGPNPPEGVENIAAPVFAIYGELDQRINAGIETIRREMQSHGKSFTHRVYPGAQHAFNNDTNAERYHPNRRASHGPMCWSSSHGTWRAEHQRTRRPIPMKAEDPHVDDDAHRTFDEPPGVHIVEGSVATIAGDCRRRAYRGPGVMDTRSRPPFPSGKLCAT
jgi:hypothetical protein